MFNPSIIEFFKKNLLISRGDKMETRAKCPIVAKIGISTLKGLHIENI